MVMVLSLGKRYPKAVKCFITDEEQLLNFSGLRQKRIYKEYEKNYYAREKIRRLL